MKLFDFGFLILMLAIIGGISLANPRECTNTTTSPRLLKDPAKGQFQPDDGVSVGLLL